MKKLILVFLSPLMLSLLISCSSQKEDASLKEITIVVKANNNIVLDNEIVPFGKLLNKLKSYGDNKKLEINIKPEKNVEMSFIQEVQNVIRTADITKISYDGNLK